MRLHFELFRPKGAGGVKPVARQLPGSVGYGER
jgi:hypothetical protein